MSHALQSLTDLDESATILSVDGVGAFDLVSRKSVAFRRQFYGSPSTFFWETSWGPLATCSRVKVVSRATHSCPCCSPSDSILLVAVSERLQVGELLFAFLDDLYIKCSPDRAVEYSHILRQEFWQHCRISLNNGNIRLWNRQGLFPRDCEVLEDAARLVDPDAVVWKGDPELPLSQQEIKILGNGTH